MKRRMIGVMTAAAMGLSLAGCGANAAPAIETSTAAQEEAPTTEKAAEPEEAERRKQKKRTKPQKNQLRTQAAHWWLDLIRIFLLWDF